MSHTEMSFPTVSPLVFLSPDEKKKLLTLESRLKQKIIGQDAAIDAICKAIRRNSVGFKNPARPAGSFLFMGTTGVGKTELCRALAEVLYGDDAKLIKIDMSEYMDKWEVTKLYGAAPGYLGHDSGGQLTNAILENPKSILCIDEIEKAHHDVFNVFLQILEDGVLTSGRGEKVSFRDVLIVMTSNIGSETLSQNKNPIGFVGDYNEELDIKSKIKADLKKTFKPEFLNRLDDVIIFDSLEKKSILKICDIMLNQIMERARNLNIKLTFEKSVAKELVKEGYDKEYGARPLRRVISAQIEDMLAEKVICGELNIGDSITVSYTKKGYVITKEKSVFAVAAGSGECDDSGEDGLW